MLHQAASLSAEKKAAAELLLGRPIADQETISIQAFSPSKMSDEQRLAAIEKLRSLFSEVNQNLAAAADDEAEEVFEEAMRSSRPGFSQVR